MIRKLLSVTIFSLSLTANAASAGESAYWHDLMFIIGAKSGIIPYEPVPVPDRFDPAPMRLAFNDRPAVERKKIQSVLAGYGYLDGSADGVWGGRTWAAIDRYARAANVWQGLATPAGSGGILDHITMSY